MGMHVGFYKRHIGIASYSKVKLCHLLQEADLNLEGRVFWHLNGIPAKWRISESKWEMKAEVLMLLMASQTGYKQESDGTRRTLGGVLFNRSVYKNPEGELPCSVHQSVRRGTRVCPENNRSVPHN
jgi:hypothetical protein